MAEVELFAASLAPWGIRPIFFSGCPVACEQATAVIKHMECFPIDKSRGPESFNASAWRCALAQAAVQALSNQKTKPYQPTGPFEARVTLQQGKAAAVRLARRWNFDQTGEQIRLQADQIDQLYLALIKLCYLTPLTARILPLALMASNLRGRLGIIWARRRLHQLGCFKSNK